MSNVPDSTQRSSGDDCQLDIENGGEDRGQLEAEAAPMTEPVRYRQPSLGGSSVDQLALNNRLPARQQIPDPNLSLHQPQDTYNNNHSSLPAQLDAYSVLHSPNRVASIGEGNQSQLNNGTSTSRASINDGNNESTRSKVRRKLSQQENSLSLQKSASRMDSKLPLDRGIVGSSSSKVVQRKSAINGVNAGNPISPIGEAASPDQCASLPQAQIRPLQSRNSHISHASTTMTPAPMPDGGLQRQEPLAPQQTGAFAVLPGIAIQHQPKGALTPHPKRLGSSRRRRLFGNRVSKELAEGANPPNVTTGAVQLPPGSVPLDTASAIPPPTTMSSIAATEASNPYARNQSKVSITKRNFVIAALCGVISIAIVVGVGFKLKQNKQTTSDNDPLFSKLRLRLQELSSDPRAVFERSESPQVLGLEWIYEDIKTNGEDRVLDNEFRLEARYALAVLYYALGGSRWSEKYRFLSHDHHECEWNGSEEQGNQGIQCDSNDHVTKLWLEDNNLIGFLPEELRALRHLEHLMLLDNQVTGSIPDLGELSYLTRLTLSSNRLKGKIPSSIGRLKGLLYLEVDKNDLTGSIPSEIGSLSLLRRLHVEGNMLSGPLPASLSNLTRLNSLRFHLNKDISGPLPEKLGSLSNLKFFIGAENSLTGHIPWSTFPMNSQMVEWNIEENFLGGSFPSFIGSIFPSLESLNARNNQISGSLPESLFEMNKTKELILQDNLLIGTLSLSISNMVSLTVLDLSGNRLIGSLPTELGLLEDLETLNLSQNSLSGRIATELGLLTKLKQLDLSGNDGLERSVPIELQQRCTNGTITCIFNV